MNLMITCIVCNEERRVDRMSTHILSKHRNNVVECKLNKEILEENIRTNECTINICLTGPTGQEQRVHCSFGYVSGWKTSKLPKASMEKAKANRIRHKEICQKLLEDSNPLSIQKKDNPELATAYKNLEKLHKRLQSEYDDVNEESTNEMVFHNTLLEVIAHRYKINKQELSELEDDIRGVLTDDTLTDEERQKTIRHTYLK